ncbi:MAG: extracellular solute-binding protein [Treponema sp.]|nr:extracellular solute-binding protein [Treponema sp.]
MKKGMFVLVALAVSSAVIFANGASQSREGSGTGSAVVRWSFWGGEARIKNTQLAIDQFTQNTGIIVAAEPAPGTGDHFNKFKTQFAGGNAADIIQLGGDFSNLQVGDNVGSVLLSLDPFVASGVIDLSKVDSSAVTEGTVNGVLYALPLAANMPALLYNKSLLQRVGAPLPQVSMTWDEFRSWLTDVKGKLPTGMYPLADNSANSDQSVFFGYWCGQNGTVMWDGKQTHLTVGDVQKYFELWADYRRAGLIPPAEAAADYSEANESSSSLISGKTAACVIWSNQLLNYQNAIEDELDLIEFPNAAITNTLWGQMSQMMAISKNSKNAEAAAKFINYRVNDISVWNIMGADPGTPVNAAGRSAVATTPAARKIAAYLDVAGAHARPRDPNMPGDTEWNSSFFLIAQNVAYGKLSSAQAGQQVMDLIARLTR